MYVKGTLHFICMYVVVSLKCTYAKYAVYIMQDIHDSWSLQVKERHGTWHELGLTHIGSFVFQNTDGSGGL